MRAKIKCDCPFVAGSRQQDALGQFGGHIGRQFDGIGQNAGALKARGQAVALGHHMHEARAQSGQEVPHRRKVSQFQACIASKLGTRGAAKIVPQQHEKVPGAVARVDNLVRRAKRSSRAGGNAFILAGQRGACLIEHFDAVHDGIIHEARRYMQGLTCGCGQHQPCARGPAGQRCRHVQAYVFGGRRKVKGRARRFFRCCAAGFAAFIRAVSAGRGGTGLKFHFLHERKKVARKARVAADAGNGGFPRFTDGFFFRGIEPGFVAAHADKNIIAAKQQPQNVAVDLANHFAQRLAGARIAGFVPVTGAARGALAPCFARIAGSAGIVGIVGHALSCTDNEIWIGGVRPWRSIEKTTGCRLMARFAAGASLICPSVLA